MIKTLSPHYVTIPFIAPLSGLQCTQYTLYIYVWTGLKTSVPTNPFYTITKDNVENSNMSDKINISELIKSEIKSNPQIGNTIELLNGNNQVWVKTETTYITADSNDKTTPSNGITKLAVRGYGYGMDGENPTLPTNKVLLRGNEYKGHRGGVFVLPLLTDEVSTNNVTVVSYPSNEINETLAVNSTTNSDEFIKYLWVELSGVVNDKYIIVNYNSVDTIITIEDECLYDPKTFMFINKEGALQSMTFFKKSIESMKVKSSSFNSRSGQPLFGNHQHVKYNINANSEFKVKSGLIDETNNEVIKQLLLSEKVWLYENSLLVPIDITLENIEYKTRINDVVSSYELTYKNAFETINNV